MFEGKDTLVHKWTIYAYANETYSYLGILGRKNVYCDIYGDTYCFHNGKKYSVYTTPKGQHCIDMSYYDFGIKSTIPLQFHKSPIITEQVKEMCKDYNCYIEPTSDIERFNLIDAYGKVLCEYKPMRTIYNELRMKKGLDDFSLQMGKMFCLGDNTREIGHF